MIPFFRSVLLVGLGGACGSMARFGITRAVHKVTQMSFPVATFSINLAGSFLIGILFGFATKNVWMQQTGIALLMAGVCGGFTTFSAFSLENILLLQKGQFSIALLYSIASVVLGLLMCWIGVRLTSS